MAASYPTSIKSFPAKANGDFILHTHVTDLEAEVVALETALKTGPTVLAAASFSGAVTLTGGLNTPLVVAQGGTGLATLASAGVLVGAGTGTPTTVAPSTSGNVLTSDGSVWASTAVASSDTGLVAEGRLTLTSGTPVTTADVTGATSIYFAPYAGNRIALYDGSSAWNVRTFTEITIAVGTIAAGKPFDIFAYDNGGTVTFDAPLAWTNDTSRATSLTTQDGVLVKTGATTRRYIGTFYTTATTTTEDSFAKRFLWNYYNRQDRALRPALTSGTHTYTTATIRQWDADTAQQADLVVGVAGPLLHLHAQCAAYNSNDNVKHSLTIGNNSTSSSMATALKFKNQTQPTNQLVLHVCEVKHYPAAGRNYYPLQQYSAASGTTTWIGNEGEVAQQTSGLHGSYQG